MPPSLLQSEFDIKKFCDKWTEMTSGGCGSVPTLDKAEGGGCCSCSGLQMAALHRLLSPG